MKAEKFPLVLSVARTAEMLGVSRGLLYQELKRNPSFPRKMVGGRILIPVQSLIEYFSN